PAPRGEQGPRPREGGAPVPAYRSSSEGGGPTSSQPYSAKSATSSVTGGSVPSAGGSGPVTGMPAETNSSSRPAGRSVTSISARGERTRYACAVPRGANAKSPGPRSTRSPSTKTTTSPSST